MPRHPLALRVVAASLLAVVASAPLRVALGSMIKPCAEHSVKRLPCHTTATKERDEHSCCRKVAGLSRPRCGCGHSGETLGGSGDPSLVVKPPSLRFLATVRRLEPVVFATNARGEDPPETPPPTAAPAANAS